MMRPMVVMLAIGALAASGPSVASEKDHIAAIEREMLPAVSLAGAPARPESLAQEMARLHVPGVSVAVIHHSRIAWAKGYGQVTAGGAPVNPGTLFQAASISKPVTAVAALRLVDGGVLSLDGDVNAQLTSWRLPTTNEGPVTLRQLLAHTAAMTAHGYAGYAAGHPVPSLGQVLDGSGPANSEAVRSTGMPGKAVSYSGGGYEVVQQLMQDRSGENFPELMRRTLLAPAGMTQSRFEQPLAGASVAGAAQPHDADGRPVAGGPYTYPELAAAGLWTTPSDLARFVIAVQRSAAGAKGALLAPATAQAMLTPGLGDRALGFELQSGSAASSFSHGGANEGYRNYLFAYFPNGDGAVVMTNATQGDRLARDLVRSIAREYGWPTNRTVVRAATAEDPALNARLVGKYVIPGFGDFTVGGDASRLTLSLRPGVVERLYHSEGGEFFVLSQDTRVVFRSEGARISGRLIGQSFDLPFIRQP